MKRMTAIALLVCFTLMFAQGLACAEGIYSAPELARAVELGFGTWREDNPDVTYAQFMEMMDRTVELVDDSKLAEWKNQLTTARNSQNTFMRSNAAVILLDTAVLLGDEYTVENNHRGERGETPKEEVEWDKWSVDEDIFGSMNQKFAVASAKRTLPAAEWESYDLSAHMYSFNRESMYSGRPLLEYDYTKDSMRMDENLTYSEALLAALRLYDSGLPSERYPTAADALILRYAEARREAILNSPTTVTVIGTKYYVSNSGSDKNNGKSPEKAWATIDKVNKAKLKSGDGVFFERGGLWRDKMLFCQMGVTYSAYGVGDKPKFYGSPEDGANPEFWTLVPDTNNVWEYHIGMQEVGFMQVNGNEILEDKYIAYWDVNQQKFVVTLDLKTPFSLNVLGNHQFFCDIDLKGIEGGQIGLGNYTADTSGVTSFTQNGSSLAIWAENRGGKFYFRCDEGNPGDIYQSIEFVKSPYEGESVGGRVIQTAPSVILDNLCVQFASNTAVDVHKDCTIQNCEMSFIGGGALVYTPPEKLPQEPVILRDLVCTDDGVVMTFSQPSNVTLANNYIHDSLNHPYNLEQDLSGTFESIRINGNLFERNGAGCCMTNFFTKDDPGNVRYKDIYIENNYWMFTGGYGSKRSIDLGLDKSYSVHGYEFYFPEQYQNINYTNNVFYLTKGTMFGLVGNATLKAFTFSGNTYAFNNGGVILSNDSSVIGNGVIIST